MRNRLVTLKRLATLYGMVEEARSAEMVRAMVLLTGAEQELASQQSVLWSSNAAGRAALAESDRLGWKQAGVHATRAEWNMELLKNIRAERSLLLETARENYNASRIQSEQINHLRKEAARQAVVKEQRKEQAIGDDRFLARRRWTEMRADIIGKALPVL